MPDRTHSRGLIARTVREALDAVVSPDVGERVLGAALSQSSLSEVPEDPDQFKAFLGPFRALAVESLGDEATSTLFEELERLAERAITSRLPPRQASAPPRSRGRISSPGTRPSSQAPAGYRRARESDAPNAHKFRLTPQKIQAIPRALVPDFGPAFEHTPRSPPNSSDLPRGMAQAMGMTSTAPNALPKAAPRVIVLCSSDAGLENGIVEWVSGRAKLLVCQNLKGLLRLLDGSLEHRVVVFVDCRRPTVRPMSLAALSEELPPEVEVVLWGATPALVNELTQLFAATRQWMVCSPTLGVKEAIDRCVQLMG